MHTQLADFVKSRTEYKEIDSILRSCVHCGFCNATCPTYQLTGDELDSPRGRIYLLKQMFEGHNTSAVTQNHLDRCLSCRSCETTCPSGVEYGRLLDLGRVVVEEQVARSMVDQLQRKFMLLVFPYRLRFSKLLKLARLIKPLLPNSIANKIPRATVAEECLVTEHVRQILVLPGCVQPELAPSIDQSTARVLDKLGISMLHLNSSACCGALNYHLSDHQQAKVFAKHNIDQCWPYIENGAEAILMTASGCGLALKEYTVLLQDDVEYAAKAEKFSVLTKDISEILINEDLSIFNAPTVTVAYQSPCTMQHGQKLEGVVESILKAIGYNLTKVKDAHLCCGSAGVYSILQPELSEKLRDKKLTALNNQQPDVIATANIGCLTHLQAKTEIKVKHWIELLDESLVSR